LCPELDGPTASKVTATYVTAPDEPAALEISTDDLAAGTTVGEPDAPLTDVDAPAFSLTDTVMLAFSLTDVAVLPPLTTVAAADTAGGSAVPVAVATCANARTNVVGAIACPLPTARPGTRPVPAPSPINEIAGASPANAVS
jgi:hypothetical protein